MKKEKRKESEEYPAWKTEQCDQHKSNFKQGKITNKTWFIK